MKDLAVIHVAAVLDPGVSNARLQSWGHSTHWNDILAILRKLRPEREFIQDYPETRYLQISVDQSEATALLKKWSDKDKNKDKDGWTSLEDSISENINNPYLTD